MHTSNPSIQRAEAGGWLEDRGRLGLPDKFHLGQPMLPSETVSRKEKK